jgi:chloramphenicol 3-O-phosphotransferase
MDTQVDAGQTENSNMRTGQLEENFEPLPQILQTSNFSPETSNLFISVTQNTNESKKERTINRKTTTHRNNILDKTMHLKRETLRNRPSPHFEAITGPWKCKKHNSYDCERCSLSIAFAIVGISSELNLGQC